MGRSSMQCVPNPGLFVSASWSLLVWGSSGMSLLKRHRHQPINKDTNNHHNICSHVVLYWDNVLPQVLFLTVADN